MSASGLRCEMNARAAARALRLNLPHELSTGRSPSVIFGVGEDGQHGNFYPASYRAILAQPDWALRLRKAHTGCRKALPRADWRWRELDCASSSDALLMNVFCYPGTLNGPSATRLQSLLGVDRRVSPRFGLRVAVPLAGGRSEMTEVDMKLGSLLIEAKLTESNFQQARPGLVLRFRDLEEVFFLDELPRTRALIVDAEWDEEQARRIPVERGSTGNFASYQLIRNTLAAYATGAAFCVLSDCRRVDLIEAWHRVLRAVRSAELRCRLQMLTWQELASALPAELQLFLGEKYGITAAPLDR
jgi:hypothetical protein